MNTFETAPARYEMQATYLSDHDFRLAAHATATELAELDGAPTDIADYPSITNHLPVLPASQLGEMIRAERYAYASAIGTCALRYIITYDSDTPTPERTARLQLVQGDVPPLFASGPEADNPYMRYADRLAATFRAGSDQFITKEPAKAHFLNNTYDELLSLDPSQDATRHRLSADLLATGVEGPPEVATFLQFAHRLIDEAAEPVLPDTQTKQEIIYQLINSTLIRRSVLTVPEFRSLPVLAGHAGRPDLPALDMDRVRLHSNNDKRYRLDLDGQCTPSDVAEHISPRLQCPMRFIKAATGPTTGRIPNYLDLFIYGAINSAKGLGRHYD